MGIFLIQVSSVQSQQTEFQVLSSQNKLLINKLLSNN